MPGRPVVVEISVSLKTRQTPRFQAFSGLLLSPNYHPIAPHMGHRLHDAWPWGPRGRAVPGHPGQQFKHGVQHVAVALFQFEQPEQRKKARLLSVRDEAPRLPKPLPPLEPPVQHSAGVTRTRWPGHRGGRGPSLRGCQAMPSSSVLLGRGSSKWSPQFTNGAGGSGGGARPCSGQCGKTQKEGNGGPRLQRS